MKKADSEAYIKQFKQNGYAEEIDESTSVNSIDFRANNIDSERVNSYFNTDENENNANIEMEKSNNNK